MRVTKAVPCFPSGLSGASEGTEPQPRVGVGATSVFSFYSVFCLDQLLSSGLGL